MSQFDSEDKIPNSAVEVLQGLLESKNSPLANSFRRFKLSLNWEKIVGSSTAQSCKPTGFYNGTLFVSVSNSSLMSQLYFIKKDIVEKINQYFGFEYVKQIRFNQSELPGS